MHSTRGFTVPLTANFIALLSLGKEWKYTATWPKEIPNILRSNLKFQYHLVVDGDLRQRDYYS